MKDKDYCTCECKDCIFTQMLGTDKIRDFCENYEEDDVEYVQHFDND